MQIPTMFRFKALMGIIMLRLNYAMSENLRSGNYRQTAVFLGPFSRMISSKAG